MRNSQNRNALKLPKTFVFEITKRCNHQCSYCYAIWGTGRGRAEGVVDVRFEDFVSIVEKLINETPIKTVALSGGEPLLHEQAPQMLAYLKERGLTSVLITNGTLLSAELVPKIKNTTVVETTVLSWRPEIHDKLVGKKGAWNTAVDGLANLHPHGIKLVVVFVATKMNCPDLNKTLELAIALGAQGLMYNRLNLGKRNMEFMDELLPTPEMIKENLDILDGACEEYHLPVAVTVPIEPCVVDVRKYGNINFGKCPMAGENSYFTIDPACNVRICNHSPTILGNLKTESFSEIYFNNRHVRRYREVVPDECIDCDPELLNLCGGGCKAAAEQCTGALNRVDPFVTLTKHG